MTSESDFDEMFARQLQAEFDAEELAEGSSTSSSHRTTSAGLGRIHSISTDDSDETLSEEEMDRLIASQKAGKRSAVTESQSVHSSLERSTVAAKKPRLCNTSVDSRPLCLYDLQCYRKNEEHRRRFRHTDDSDHDLHPSNSRESPATTGRRTGPFEQLYLTRVAELRPVHNHRSIAVSIADILAEPIGNLKSSAQFNYMFEVDWLVHQYPTEQRKKPLLLVHGERHQAKRALEKQVSLYNHVRLCQAPLADIFGTHHTKMMFLLYDEGLRIVIHTANLVRGDWHQKTQGVWMSPLFPSMKTVEGAAAGGDSETKFKRDLLSYLASYSCRDLDEWTNIVRNHDMSSAKVCLVASVPGRHSGERKNLFGHLKLRSILKGPTGPPGSVVDHHWPVVGQFSSIGSLGSDANGWLCGEWLDSFTSSSTSASASTLASKLLKLVFPSVDNVRTSLEGYPAGVSLPYSKENEAKQPWLRGFLHQWRCEAHGRSSASPHIKTYLRMSPDQSRIAWMLMTSANLSKAAWGNLEKSGSQLHIRSYEIGVLFLPSHCKQPISAADAQTFCPDDILVPFDLPVTPYATNDRAWTWNAAHTDKPDRHGNVWQPT